MDFKEMARQSPVLLALAATEGKYEVAKHIILLDKYARAVARREVKRLIISMPPRFGKSTFFSQYFPAWYLCNFPDDRVILTSYESHYAATWGKKTRAVVQNMGAEYFKDSDGKPILIDPTSKAGDNWNILNHAGGMASVGMGGALTGRGANILIIDDPIKNDIQANSKTYRERNWDWFIGTVRDRLEPNAAIILIMTRWHSDDLAGRLLNQEYEDDIQEKEKWEYLNLPVYANKNDPAGRVEGELLWENRYDKVAIEALKKDITDYWWNAKFLGRPIQKGKELVAPEQWRYNEYMPNCRHIIQSWDTAFKDNDWNSYTVCTTMGMFESGYQIIDMMRERLTYPLLKKRLKEQYSMHKPDLVLIEDKASGQDLINELNYETPIPILPIKIEHSMTKETRATLATPLFEAGKVYLLKGDPHNKDIISEFAEFPYGAFNDIVDSITQGLKYLKDNYSYTSTVGRRSSVSKRIKKPSITQGFN
jgi:predicted phage terminase large subunit-like protein